MTAVLVSISPLCSTPRYHLQWSGLSVETVIAETLTGWIAADRLLCTAAAPSRLVSPHLSHLVSLLPGGKLASSFWHPRPLPIFLYFPDNI